MAKIADVQEVSLEKLRPYERNAKKHGAGQIEKLKASIMEFGFLTPCLIDSDYNLIAGHGRVMAAKELGIETVSCVFIEGLTEEQRRAYILADNRLGELGEWDMELVFDELAELDDLGFDVELTGFDMPEELPEAVEDDFDDSAVPDEPRTKLGDLWQLGGHRLICGDSTDVTVIDRLMDGVKADMVFTDPPYALVGNSTGLGSATDDMLKPFFLAIFKNICKFTHDLMHVYVCCDWKSCNAILTEAKKTQLTEKSLIVWDKESVGLGSPYMSQHELIWFFENHKQKTMQAGKAEYKNRRNIKGKSNVWKYKRVQDRKHNAQKPVELVAEALNNSCFENEIVLDLFGGSGSTLIACEQLNRKCYMCELDPKYVDVIVERWENFTGKKAVLING